MKTIGYEQSGNLYINHNTFKKLINKYLKELTIENSQKCDLIIKSPLSGDVWNKNKLPYIYWSGESREVSHSEYHTKYLEIYSFISNNQNSIYIPFCLESDHIYKDRVNLDLNRKYILGYCASNKIQKREELYSKFVEKAGIKNCIAMGDCFGNYKQTQQKLGGDYQSIGNISTYSNCKFILAMENLKRDGYVTEKIINAFYSGAIPIYWGSPNINELFNKNAFINVDDFKTLDQCVDYVLNMSDEERAFILSQPFYKGDLINIINDDYNKHNDNKILKEYSKKIEQFFKV